MRVVPGSPEAQFLETLSPDDPRHYGLGGPRPGLISLDRQPIQSGINLPGNLGTPMGTIKNLGDFTLTGTTQQPIRPGGRPALPNFINQPIQPAGGLTLTGMAQQPIQQPSPFISNNTGLGSFNYSQPNQQLGQLNTGGLKSILDNYLNNYLDNYFRQAFNQR